MKALWILLLLSGSAFGQITGGYPAPSSNVLAGQFLTADLPDPSTNIRKYAWTTDLFGGPGDYTVSDGVNWKPVRPLSVLSQASANMTATSLLTPPTIILTGTIGTGITHTVTLSTTYAYKGAKFRVLRKAGGLGTLLVNTIGLNLSAWADFEYDGSAWVETASGGLL